jgi:hypothetical protein
MKLYTEEQMIRAFNYGKTLEPFDCFEDMIKSLKPIKISSDNTAIDWVIEKLRILAHNPNTHLGMGDIRVTQGYIDEIEEQAKAMEKEQQIKDDWINGDAYENYLKGGDIKWLKQTEVDTPIGKMNIPIPYTKEEFINKIKTDNEFAKKWGKLGTI